MKIKHLYTGILAFSALLFTSCKNELDVFAPGEEAVSVYGVINPNEPVQNIRINKVYLTNGDALSAGQDEGQINYGPGELLVTLTRFATGSTTPTLTTVGNPTKKEIVLTETVVTTAGGNFNTNQRIWQTTDKLFNNGEYKLTIKNLSTGKEFTSQTQMVDSVKSYSGMPFIYTNFLPPGHYPVHCGSGSGGYTSPTSGGPQTQQSAFIDYSILTAKPVIRFRSVANARTYKVIMRFHYIDTVIGGASYRNFVDMNFPLVSSNTLVGGEDLSVSFEALDFYKNIADKIPGQSAPNIKNRTSHYMQYIIYACSENMNTFLQVNQPSNTIAQDKPNYTNINGGVGVFASLSKSSISKELWYAFITEISNNPITQSLQFNTNTTFICP